ncbi:hypothetical protein GCM10012287_45710 [Streptomyces daqingensis]|uniref:Secreted protein n=1 Tax=Streptomyces daqingensis TaxID=1472640 RepID=A0ABQ2MNJ1_9ACTN|nr:hypothetical protein GCM10012287_45710 [Streptomyces daqingensis]
MLVLLVLLLDGVVVLVLDSVVVLRLLVLLLVLCVLGGGLHLLLGGDVPVQLRGVVCGNRVLDRLVLLRVRGGVAGDAVAGTDLRCLLRACRVVRRTGGLLQMGRHEQFVGEGPGVVAAHRAAGDAHFTLVQAEHLGDGLVVPHDDRERCE